jgi:hypothetical protein
MLDSFRVIRLETNDKSLIGGYIGKIKKNNHLYYISSDRKELLIFDRDGTFRQKIGNVGNGPGEYSALSDYDIFENGDILILDINKLIMYNNEGVYIKTIPLSINPFNLKITSAHTILLYSSNDNYMIHEIDLSGKTLSQKFKPSQSSRLGKNIAFVTCGDHKIICQIGRSNNCIFYDSGSHEFAAEKLLCDNDIMTASKEENFIKNHGLNYLKNFSDIKFIDGISGCNTHLMFGYGSVKDGFTAQILNLEHKSIRHVISSNDINDVTFTSPFFMEYACIADGQDCFITWVSPEKIKIGMEQHREFADHPNYRTLEKMFPADAVEMQEENPCLVEFIFK